METLDRLFSEARNEAPETTLSDVQKWIVPMTLGALIIAFFAKTKLIITLKPFIMISSAIVAVGIGTGVVLTMNTSTEQKQIPSPEKNSKHVEHKQDPKPNETVLATVNTPSQELVAEGEQQPVLRMLETWNDEEILLPSLSYCQSLPVAPVLPYKPLEPVQRLQTIPTTGQVIEVKDFNALRILGAVDVVLMQGEAHAVRIEGTVSDDAKINITNKGNILEVSTSCEPKRKNGCNFDAIVYITVVELKTINCSGASTIKSEGQLNFETLEVELSGASDLYLNMSATKLKLNSSGASDINLEGKVENLSVVNSGASDLNAADLDVKKANVNCSGASVITVNVTDDLVIDASGASEVYIKGSPLKVEKNVTGASEIKNIK